jgi:hypothetical protein
MFEQQLYTRTNFGGIRARTPGFDTVAASKGLSKDDLVDIEQLCEYNIPQEYYAADPEHLAPEVHYMCETQRGNVVIGMSVYRKEEGERGRSVFLAHNYVLKRADSNCCGVAKSIDDYVSPDPNGFIRSFPDDGKEQPPLERKESLAADSANMSDDAAILQQPDIDYTMLVKLAFAALLALQKNKKIFIALRCEDAELSSSAQRVLQRLFKLLPYDVRFKCGFNTFFTGEGTKKGLVLHFMPKGMAPSKKLEQKIGARNIINDYVFNFDNPYFTNIEGIEEEAPQLWGFLNKHMWDDSELDNLWSLAHGVLKNQGMEALTSIWSYNRIAELEPFLTTADAIGLHGKIVECSEHVKEPSDNSDATNLLLPLLLEKLQERLTDENVFVGADDQFPDKVIELLGKLSHGNPSDYSEVTMAILGVAFGQVELDERYQYKASSMFDSISKADFPDELDDNIEKTVIAKGGWLAGIYIDKKLSRNDSISELLEQAKELFNKYPVLRANRYVLESFDKKLKEIVTQSGTQSGSQIENIKELESARSTIVENDADLKDLENLLEENVTSLFSQIDLNNLPKEDVQKLASYASGKYQNQLMDVLERYQKQLDDGSLDSIRIEVLHLFKTLDVCNNPDVARIIREVIKALFTISNSTDAVITEKIEQVECLFSLEFYKDFLNKVVAPNERVGRPFVAKRLSVKDPYRAILDDAINLFSQYENFEEVFRGQGYGADLLRKALNRCAGAPPYQAQVLDRIANAKDLAVSNPGLNYIYGEFVSDVIMEIDWTSEYHGDLPDLHGVDIRGQAKDVLEEKSHLHQPAVLQAQYTQSSTQGVAYPGQNDRSHQVDDAATAQSAHVIPREMSQQSYAVPVAQQTPDPCQYTPAHSADCPSLPIASNNSSAGYKNSVHDTSINSIRYDNGKGDINKKKLTEMLKRKKPNEITAIFKKMIAGTISSGKTDENKKKEWKVIIDCTREAFNSLDTGAAGSQREDIERVFSDYCQLASFGFSSNQVFDSKQKAGGIFSKLLFSKNR